MNDITPKEAIANLNHIYGMVAPDIQRSLDVAIKALERPTGDCISRSDLVQAFKEECCGNCHLCERFAVFENGIHHCGLIDNAPTVPQVTVFAENADEKAVADLKAELQSVIEPRPQGNQIACEQGYEAGLVQGKHDIPKGEWKNIDGKLYCPFCMTYSDSAFNNYCSRCGADMRGAAE